MANTTQTKSEITIRGPALWAEIHLRALDWDPKNNDVAYLRRLAYRLREISQTCECRYFYTKWKEDNPPDYKKYFEWTVKLHNAVNKKLGKPTMTLANARKHWARVKNE